MITTDENVLIPITFVNYGERPWWPQICMLLDGTTLLVLTIIGRKQAIKETSVGRIEEVLESLLNLSFSWQVEAEASLDAHEIIGRHELLKWDASNTKVD